MVDLKGLSTDRRVSLIQFFKLKFDIYWKIVSNSFDILNIMWKMNELHFIVAV